MLTKFPMQRVFSGSLQGDALTFPAQRTTPPVSGNGVGVVECTDFATATVILGGTNGDGDLINYQAIGWRKAIVGGVTYYLPTIMASGVATLGTYAMSALGASNLAADTLTDTIAAVVPSAGSAASLARIQDGVGATNRVSLLILDVAGFDYVEIDTDIHTGAVSASCLIGLGEP